MLHAPVQADLFKSAADFGIRPDYHRGDVATVFIPSMLRPLAEGHETLDISGVTVREIVDALAARYPELGSRLLDQRRLRANISVAIDGEVSTLGLLDQVSEDSEVHFIPAISGGRGRSHAISMG